MQHDNERAEGGAYAERPNQSRTQATIGGISIPAPWQGGIKLEDVKNNIQNFNINDLKARFAKPNPQRDELRSESPFASQSTMRDYSVSPSAKTGM